MANDALKEWQDAMKTVNPLSMPGYYGGLHKNAWNELFSTLKKIGLNPTDFERDERAGTIKQRSGRGYFQISVNPFTPASGDHFDVSYWPSARTTARQDSGGLYWEQVMQLFSRWGENLKSDVGTPDLWEELAKQSKEIQFPQEELILTPSEKRELNERIEDARKLLLEAANPNTSLEINRKLDYLIAKTNSESLTRKDWKMIFLGTLTSLAVERLVTPQNVETALQIVFTAIHGFLG